MKRDNKFEQDELEVNLPKWLSESIDTYQNGKDSSLWDCLPSYKRAISMSIQQNQNKDSYDYEDR